MFKGVDHIVVAVKDLEAAVGRYETIYGMPVSERREAPPAGMRMAFFRFADSYLELVSNIDDQGPIAKRLADRGEGVHLIAMQVDDLEKAVGELRGWWATLAPAIPSRARCSSTRRKPAAC
jgi:lactoylglutathione lyase/methylmalonyl-CoA/ethylmalonyl-CoA epimerase